ncbi:MAG TPA: lysoplasmalogenase [Kofleriaceae bacterium]
MNLALTIACCIGAVGFIAAEYGQARVGRVIAKLVASGAFVILGIHALPATPIYASFAHWIAIGLVLGAIGDVALLGESTPAFMSGLVAFLLGHISYVVAVAQLAPPQYWPAFGGIAVVVPIIAAVIALWWLWPHLGALRIAVIAYVIAIVLMVIAAIAIGHSELLPAPQRTYFLVGAVLFFISDLSVARNRFIEKTVRNLAWGIPAYFAGQLLIAWAIVSL